jgi:hypothetical protein
MYPQPERVIKGRFYRADGREIVCPFGIPGDRLWVRERFAEAEDGTILYAADPIKGRSRLTFQQSRYMMQEDSRLTLRVLSTRPQLVQDISEADARAEGYDPSRESLSPIDWFARLWDRLAVTESLRWAANPWLWVVHFELIEIGGMPAAELSPVTEEEKESIFDLPAEAKPLPAKTRSRTPRMATMEEKQRLAEALRSRAPG